MEWLCLSKPKQAVIPRPPLPWKCLKCGELPHSVNVIIQTEGKQDFIEETDGEFDPKRWPDGFGRFTLSIKCKKCGKKTPEWVSYETM
jgi:hypothetical protein